MSNATTARASASPRFDPSQSQTGSTTWLTPLLLGLVTLALHVVPKASSLLEFDRAALARGQLWRLLTCHLVHFNASHLLWDVATFALLACLLPRLSVQRWSVLLGTSAFAISAGVWLWQPQFEIYRGLSGVDCALFGALVVARTRDAGRERDYVSLAVVFLATIGFVAKCAYELLTQSPAFAAAGDFVPVPLAHLLGAIVGATFARTHRQAPDRLQLAPSRIDLERHSRAGTRLSG